MALNLLPQAGQNLVLAGAILLIMAQPGTVRTTGEISGEDQTLEEQTLEEAIEEREADPSGYLQPCATGGLRSCRQPAGGEIARLEIPLVVIETSRTRVDELRERGLRCSIGQCGERRNYATGASGMCKMADPRRSPTVMKRVRSWHLPARNSGYCNYRPRPL